MIYAAGYGYLFWNEVLSLRFVSGAVLIAAAGVLALRGHPRLVKPAEAP